jgi:hypothetical protein
MFGLLCIPAVPPLLVAGHARLVRSFPISLVAVWALSVLVVGVVTGLAYH